MHARVQRCSKGGLAFILHTPVHKGWFGNAGTHKDFFLDLTRLPPTIGLAATVKAAGPASIGSTGSTDDIDDDGPVDVRGKDGSGMPGPSASQAADVADQTDGAAAVRAETAAAEQLRKHEAAAALVRQLVQEVGALGPQALGEGVPGSGNAHLPRHCPAAPATCKDLAPGGDGPGFRRLWRATPHAS